MADFLVIGHVVKDIVPGGPGRAGWRLGGTAAYASLQAVALGRRVALLTSASAEIDLESSLPGVEALSIPAQRPTEIENIYTGSGRVQYIHARAPTLSPDALPQQWQDCPIVLLGPVVGEVGDRLAARFPRSLIGVSAQGWLREVGPDRRVRPVSPRRWHCADLLRGARALFVSDEDIAPEAAPAALKEWSALVPIVAFTRGEKGADIHYQGRWRHIEAFPAQAVDPTGAGDVFAAAFLIRLQETDDAGEAARFASAAASFIVAAEGTSGIASRQEIEKRLGEHPGIVLR